MTKLEGNAKVVRETRAKYRTSPLIVEVNTYEIVVREKGRRFRVAVPILAAYMLGFKILAREERIEKLKKKGKK